MRRTRDIRTGAQAIGTLLAARREITNTRDSLIETSCPLDAKMRPIQRRMDVQARPHVARLDALLRRIDRTLGALL